MSDATKLACEALEVVIAEYGTRNKQTGMTDFPVCQPAPIAKAMKALHALKTLEYGSTAPGEGEGAREATATLLNYLQTFPVNVTREQLMEWLNGMGRRMRDVREALSAAPGESGDWPEDAAHENGNYSCQCVTCGRTFTGHKRRVVCKSCAAAAPGESGDWRVSTSELARKILNYLGVGSEASLEPGIDRRRDKIAAMIEQYFVTSATTAPGESEGGGIDLDKMLRQRFFRSAPIEEQLLLAGTGKRPLPTADECREWAIRLGVPDEARPYAPPAAPAAWLHMLHGEGGGVMSRLSFDPAHSFGLPGRDYSAEFEITSTPLYDRPPAAPAGEAGTVPQHVYESAVRGRRHFRQAYRNLLPIARAAEKLRAARERKDWWIDSDDFSAAIHQVCEAARALAQETSNG